MLESLKLVFGPAKGLLRLGFQALELAGWRAIGTVREPDRSTAFRILSKPHSNTVHAFNQLKSSLYNKQFAATLHGQASDIPTRRLFERIEDQSLLNRMLYVDTKTWLPDDLLVKADKMTMATSVELRVPLLDFHVLEFAASLPQRYKVRGWQLKRVLKAALGQSVPPEIIGRRKTGFPVPYDVWMRKEMKDFVFDTVLAKNAAAEAYFCRRTVSKLLAAHQKSGRYAKEVFCLLVFELWHRRFLGTP